MLVALAVVDVLARPTTAAVSRVQQDAIAPGHPAVVGVHGKFHAAQPGWVQAGSWVLRGTAQLTPALAAVRGFQDLRVIPHDIRGVGIHRIHALQLGHSRERSHAEGAVAQRAQHDIARAGQPQFR